jgi:hypothetical protein
MSNSLYAGGAQRTLNALVDWATADIRVMALDSTYVVDLAAHEYLSDVNASAQSSGVALTGKSITGGYFDADDINLTLTAGTCKALIFYVHNASPAAAPLLAYVNNILGFPFTTSGGVLPIVWPNGTKKILSLRGG